MGKRNREEIKDTKGKNGKEGERTSWVGGRGKGGMETKGEKKWRTNGRGRGGRRIGGKKVQRIQMGKNEKEKKKRNWEERWLEVTDERRSRKGRGKRS
jgi:hypothetical protein